MSDLQDFRLSHVGICVSDLDRSLRFYRDGLGFTESDTYRIDSETVPAIGPALEVDGDVAMTSQFLSLRNLRLELIAYERPPTHGTPSASRGALGLTHLAFRVSDLDATLAHLLECGGTEIESTNQNVGIRLVMVADPDGTRVELMEYR